MNPENKKTLLKFGKISLLFIIALVAISTSMCAINTFIGFYIATGILNLLFSGYCIYNLWKYLIKE